MGRTSRSNRSASGQQHDTSFTGGAFPLWISLGSTIAALILFFSATVPAIAEMRYLGEVAHERIRFDEQLSEELDRDALHRIGLEYDLQTLLVELDKRGIPCDSILSNDPDGQAGQAHENGGDRR